ncbi:MAG: hypothetical protein AAB490_02350, partial [Patescibacteria group bacterium]
SCSVGGAACDPTAQPHTCNVEGNGSCVPGQVCNRTEQCDPKSAKTFLQCDDNGDPGLKAVECNATCKLIETACHAYGLKVWSDAVDVAYLNGSLMLFDDSRVPAPQRPALCSVDPDYQAATGYASPASPVGGNSCVADDEAPYQSAQYAATDIRPVDSSGKTLPPSFEFPGTNVLAIKAWTTAAAANRGFEAVFTSRGANKSFVTTPGIAGGWVCSNDYTAGWNTPYCPSCDPNFPGSTWRAPTSYTNAGGVPSACTQNYTNYAGGDAKWIWSSSCDATAGTRVVYCRLGYSASGIAAQAGWNPNFGWVYTVTAGSQVGIAPNVMRCENNAATSCTIATQDTDCGVGNECWHTLAGAAWNKNLGWLRFDGSNSPFSANPIGTPVLIDRAGKLRGTAWGENFGEVRFDSKNVCGYYCQNDPTLVAAACSTNPGISCISPADFIACKAAGGTCDCSSTPAGVCGAANDCVQSQCQVGLGGRTYKDTQVTISPPYVLTGYSWSEDAGWIDWAANTNQSIVIPGQLTY